ncbi:MAG: hypothetical protein GDA50_00130, partial [Alphaproteobacteria bacterium GM202ARS2]|nr:hypothetical protein [Alphaproteobacteria bacterium GM202ARS2]
MTLHLYAQRPPAATLVHSNQSIPCTIGRNGITAHKHEGDHALPIGIFPLRYILWRRDRLHVNMPATHLPRYPIIRSMGWCHDPRHPHYNQAISLPHPHLHPWKK